MKLAVLALILGLAAPSVASADTLDPPGGPVYVDTDAGPPPPRAERGPRGQRDPRGQRGQRGQRDPQAVANRQKLRQALLVQFDANGDGKLGPRERMRAVRVLRRIEQRLATGPQQGQGQRQGGQGRARPGRDQQYRRFMRRYDVNGDGQVGPREVPRGAADRLRKFDRNGDGWVDQNEMP